MSKKKKGKKQVSEPEKRERRGGPANLSGEARIARGQGERAWARWTLKDVAEEAQRLNPDITLDVLKKVRCRDWVKVKLLERREAHKVHLRQEGELKNKRVPHFRIDEKKTRKLTVAKVLGWADTVPNPEELEEIIVNLTDHHYWRPKPIHA